MEISLSTNSATVSKYFDQAENEDFIYNARNDDGYFLWVVCDGAGGSGVFCKEWAEFIATNIPLNPETLKNTYETWLVEISEKFYKTILTKKDLSDLILNKKVHRDGSNSTMSAVWLNQIDNTIYFSSVGDSCIFYFESKNGVVTLKAVSPYNTFSEIESPSPMLLNWNAPFPLDLDLIPNHIEKDFSVVIASDSLARWIIQILAIIDLEAVSGIFNTDFLESLNKGKYEERKTAIRFNNRLNSITELTSYLKQFSETQETFNDNIKFMLESEQIDLDDYSLIFINGHVSK